MHYKWILWLVFVQSFTAAEEECCSGSSSTTTGSCLSWKSHNLSMAHTWEPSECRSFYLGRKTFWAKQRTNSLCQLCLTVVPSINGITSNRKVLVCILTLRWSSIVRKSCQRKPCVVKFNFFGGSFRRIFLTFFWNRCHDDLHQLSPVSVVKHTISHFCIFPKFVPVAWCPLNL